MIHYELSDAARRGIDSDEPLVRSYIRRVGLRPWPSSSAWDGMTVTDFANRRQVLKPDGGIATEMRNMIDRGLYTR